MLVARESSHRRTLTPEEIRELLSRRGLFAFDRLPVPGATRADLDDRLMEQFAARFRSGRRMEADLRELHSPGRLGGPMRLDIMRDYGVWVN